MRAAAGPHRHAATVLPADRQVRAAASSGGPGAGTTPAARPAAARALARRAHVPARDATLVDRSTKDAHSDPLFDDPAANDFLATVVPFLERIH
jgi:hypothetical protein